MHLVFVEDNRKNIRSIEGIAQDDKSLNCHFFPDVVACKDVLERDDADIVFLSADLQKGLGFRQDLSRVKAMSGAPTGLIVNNANEDDVRGVMSEGVDVVLERRDLCAALLRQSVKNLKGRRAVIGLRQVQETLFTLIAPLEYIEFGLMTLLDASTQPGRDRTRGFLQHLLETVQTLIKLAQSRHHPEMLESVGRLVEAVRARLMRLSAERNIALRIDWETAHIQASPAPLAELGLMHFLEGLLRCCGQGDGAWVYGEKTSDASVIRVHLSRRVLDSVDLLHPGAVSGPGVGLDAMSSIQLGAVLLSLSRNKIELSSINRQQMLSVYL